LYHFNVLTSKIKLKNIYFKSKASQSQKLSSHTKLIFEFKEAQPIKKTDFCFYLFAKKMGLDFSFYGTKAHHLFYR